MLLSIYGGLDRRIRTGNRLPTIVKTTLVFVTCRDPAYSGSLDYAEFGAIFTIYNTVKTVCPQLIKAQFLIHYIGGGEMKNGIYSN